MYIDPIPPAPRGGHRVNHLCVPPLFCLMCLRVHHRLSCLRRRRRGTFVCLVFTISLSLSLYRFALFLPPPFPRRQLRARRVNASALVTTPDRRDRGVYPSKMQSGIQLNFWVYSRPLVNTQNLS